MAYDVKRSPEDSRSGLSCDQHREAPARPLQEKVLLLRKPCPPPRAADSEEFPNGGATKSPRDDAIQDEPQHIEPIECWASLRGVKLEAVMHQQNIAALKIG